MPPTASYAHLAQGPQLWFCTKDILMTYNATHSHLVERAVRTLDVGDFFLVSNGLTMDNLTLDNPVNAVIRNVSRIPFGHAGLYVGHGAVIDLPFKLWPVKDMFAKYKSNGAALVRCKTLTKGQRGRIRAFAKAFQADYEADAGMSYGSAAMITGAVGEVGTAAARTMMGDFFGKQYSKVFQAPATAVSMSSAAAHAFFGVQPALSCSAFITYAHATAGHTIQDRPWMDILSHPTHCTPGDLWDIAIADKRKYDIEILDFSKDMGTDTARQVEGIDTSRYQQQVQRPGD